MAKQGKHAPHLARYPWIDTVKVKPPSPWGMLWAGLFMIPAFGGGVWIGYLLTPESRRLPTLIIMLFILGLILFVLISKFIDELAQEDGFDALRNDPRPPVVFLRSFYEDDRTFYDRKFMPEAKTRETIMAEAMRAIGPFVAIGKPGEGHVRIGAARLYVVDEQWRPVVASLVEHAAAIVLQPDDTPGTRWEISAVASLGDLRRVLLLVPNPQARPLGYERVRTAAMEFLPPLPEAPGPCEAFVFDDGVTPRPLVPAREADATAYFFVRQIRALEASRA